MRQSAGRAKIIAGILLILVPIYLLGLWFYSISKPDGYAENQLLYQSYLPDMLKGRYPAVLLSLVCCAIAIILNINILNKPGTRTTALSKVIIIAALVFGFINLWSIM
ncbi:MAG: hypothetical protein WCF67_22290 [Chitinophagaceae bacterium]